MVADSQMMAGRRGPLSRPYLRAALASLGFEGQYTSAKAKQAAACASPEDLVRAIPKIVEAHDRTFEPVFHIGAPFLTIVVDWEELEARAAQQRHQGIMRPSGSGWREPEMSISDRILFPYSSKMLSAPNKITFCDFTGIAPLARIVTWADLKRGKYFAVKTIKDGGSAD